MTGSFKLVVVTFFAVLGFSLPSVRMAVGGPEHDARVTGAPASYLNVFGVNYLPNHYPQFDARNFEDQSNVYPEMLQLKAAGFNTVRMYGNPGKTWIAVINAAGGLGMNVVYLVALCQSYPSNYSDASLRDHCVNSQFSNLTFDSVEAASLQQLDGILTVVGTDQFKSVVPLVLVGNEVLFSTPSSQPYDSNMSKIIDAVHKVRSRVDKLGIPVSTALEADVWVSTDPHVQNDLNRLINAFVPGANSPPPPIAINVYPFQWVVPASQSVSDVGKMHSLAWYLDQLANVRHYSNPIFISETGWATEGIFNFGSNRTVGNLADAEVYYNPASGEGVYQYVKDAQSNVVKTVVPLLGFEAFDEPAKSTDPNFTSENHYGLFATNCQVKSPNLLPLKNSPTPGCADGDTLFTLVGLSNTIQPPFTIIYTHASSTFTVLAQTENRTNTLTPWPTITLTTGDTVTLKSSTHNCTNTVSAVNSNHQGGMWQMAAVSDCPTVNWANGESVFMPADF